jgi:hypothetical protein
MATTRIEEQALSVGNTAISVPFTPDGDSVSLTFSVEQVGTVASQVRSIVRDSDGLVVESQVINGTGSKRSLLVDGTLTIEMSCLLGTVIVSAVESTGGGLVSGDLSTDSVTSAKFSGAGIVDTEQIADDAITDDHITDATIIGDKLVDLSVSSAALKGSASALGRADLPVAYFYDGGTIEPPSENVYGGAFRALVWSDTLGNPATVTMGAGGHIGQICIIEHVEENDTWNGQIFVITNGGWLDGGAADDRAAIQDYEPDDSRGVLICVCVGGNQWRALAWYYTVFS